MTALKDLPQLKFGTGWVSVEIMSEPEVVLTARGYAPVVRARALGTGLEYLWYISAKSLAEPVEVFRKDNDGRFKGLRLNVCKESSDPMARYKVEAHRPDSR